MNGEFIEHEIMEMDKSNFASVVELCVILFFF